MGVNLPVLCSSLQFHAMPLKITLVRFHLGTIDTVFLYSDNVASLLSLGIFFSFQSPLYKNVSFKVFLNSFLSNSSCAWFENSMKCCFISHTRFQHHGERTKPLPSFQIHVGNEY